MGGEGDDIFQMQYGTAEKNWSNESVRYTGEHCSLLPRK